MTTSDDSAATTDDADATVGTLSPADVARLPAAVAGIAQIVPRPPEGLLAPHLRTPLLALSVALAVGLHASGLGAMLVMGWGEGDGGKLAGGLGANVIEVDIIDGPEWPGSGGRTEEAATGIPLPLAAAAIDQAVARPDPNRATEAEPVAPAALPPPPPELSTPLPAPIQVAAMVPPPPFTLDTSSPPVVDPPRPQPEPIEKTLAEQRTDDVPKNALDDPMPLMASPDPSMPDLQASRASLGGDDASTQARIETPGNGGQAGASLGEIASYHSRLGAHLRANRPISRGRPGKVVVLFVLEADGGLRNVRIIESSGNQQLEAKTLAAIQKASPFPRPPRGMTGAALEFKVPFSFHQ